MVFVQAGHRRCEPACFYASAMQTQRFPRSLGRSILILKEAIEPKLLCSREQHYRILEKQTKPGAFYETPSFIAFHRRIQRLKPKPNTTWGSLHSEMTPLMKQLQLAIGASRLRADSGKRRKLKGAFRSVT